MEHYKKTRVYWDTVFNDVNVRLLASHKSGHEDLDKALDWMSEDTTTVLDFGSGSGAILAFLAKRKPGDYYGIDVSQSAIELANRLFAHNDLKTGHFQVGSIERLKAFEADMFDAVILSNILDNLNPRDALAVLNHSHRLLKTNGKLLIKLNPYYEDQTLAGTRTRMDKDFYLEQNGLYLWNKDNAYWLKQLEKDYVVMKQAHITLHDKAYNRLFLCVKKPSL